MFGIFVRLKPFEVDEQEMELVLKEVQKDMSLAVFISIIYNCESVYMGKVVKLK